jgi:hypothetical protein
MKAQELQVKLHAAGVKHWLAYTSVLYRASMNDLVQFERYDNFAEALVSEEICGEPLGEEAKNGLDVMVVQNCVVMLWTNIKEEADPDENRKWLAKSTTLLAKVQGVLWRRPGLLGTGEKTWATQANIGNLITMFSNGENSSFEELRDAGEGVKKEIANGTCGLYQVFAGCESHDVMVQIADAMVEQLKGKEQGSKQFKGAQAFALRMEPDNATWNADDAHHFETMMRRISTEMTSDDPNVAKSCISKFPALVGTIFEVQHSFLTTAIQYVDVVGHRVQEISAEGAKAMQTCLTDTEITESVKLMKTLSSKAHILSLNGYLSDKQLAKRLGDDVMKKIRSVAQMEHDVSMVNECLPKIPEVLAVAGSQRDKPEDVELAMKTMKLTDFLLDKVIANKHISRELEIKLSEVLETISATCKVSETLAELHKTKKQELVAIVSKIVTCVLKQPVAQLNNLTKEYS